MAAASLPPKNMLLLGALAIGGIWYMRNAKGGTLPGVLKPAGTTVPKGTAPYLTSPARPGLPSPAVPVNPGGRSILDRIFNPAQPSIVTPNARAAVRAGDDYYGTNAAVAGAGQFLSSLFGVPNAAARAAVRAGDSYYGSGNAGNNTSPAESFRRSEIMERSTENVSPEVNAAREAFRESEYSDPAYYGNQDMGPITVPYDYGMVQAQEDFRRQEYADENYGFAMDEVPINPAPGSDFSPEIFEASNWTDADYSDYFQEDYGAFI